MNFYNGDPDDEFNQLIEEYNRACEAGDYEGAEGWAAHLYKIGAWVDAAQCWRHPDDHDERTLPQILD